MEKRKKKQLWLTGAAILTGTVLFCSGMTVGAATGEPGSAGDPLITKSYLEAQLDGVGYVCITVAKGEKVFLEQGSQVILYTGSAGIHGSLIDITTGSLASNETQAEKYHNYLAPADGSGFTAHSSCVIFLSGDKY